MSRLHFAPSSPSRLRHKARGFGNNGKPLVCRAIGSLGCALVAMAVPCLALGCPAVYPVDECDHVFVPDRANVHGHPSGLPRILADTRDEFDVVLREVAQLKQSVIRPAAGLYPEQSCYSSCIDDAWAEAIELEIDTREAQQRFEILTRSEELRRRLEAQLAAGESVYRHAWSYQVRLEFLVDRVTGGWFDTRCGRIAIEFRNPTGWYMGDDDQFEEHPDVGWTHNGARVPCAYFAPEACGTPEQVAAWDRARAEAGKGAPRDIDARCQPVRLVNEISVMVSGPGIWPWPEWMQIDPTARPQGSPLDR